MQRTVRALAICLALTIPLPVIAAQFSDVPAGHWAITAIDEATSRGLMAGFPGGTFQGEKPLTRLQLVYVLRRMITEFEAAAQADLKAPSYGSLSVTDLGNRAADLPMVLELVNVYGVFPGYDLTTGQFQPNKAISRYDFARALGTLLKRAEARGMIRPAAGEPVTFTDVTPAEQDMVQAMTSQYPLMSGFPDHTFKGELPLNRYQFAASAIKALPVFRSRIVPKPTPTPTPVPTPVPTPEPTPEPTPTPVPTQGIRANLWELSGVYGVLPNSTAGLGNTEGLIGANLSAGQEIWDFFLTERVRYFHDPSATKATVGQFGLGLGWRLRPSESFHIVPSLGFDAYGVMGADGIGLAGAGGGGLSFEWWLHPAFSISLGGEARYGLFGMAVSGPVTPSIGLLYGGDLKLRYYPFSQFSIQLGASAWAIPQIATATAGMDLLVGPNLGIAWQF